MYKRWFLSRLGAVACLFFMLLSTLWPASFAVHTAAGAAAAINVTTFFDDAYTTPNGTCSLREAIRAANLDTAVDACQSGNGVDTIIIPAGFYTLRIDGPGEDDALTGDLDITESLNLIGAGQELTVIETNNTLFGDDFQFNDRILHIHSPASVQISQLTLRRGNLTGVETGAPQPRGGAVLNESTLNLNQVILRDNRAGGDSGLGGAIYNDGVLTLTASRFEENDAATSGGAIFNATDMQLTGTVFTGNTSRGGDVYGAVNPASTIDNAPEANAQITDSRFVENGSDEIDEPIDDVPVMNSGIMQIETSEFWRNYGLIAGALANEGELRIEDSLFQANDGNNIDSGGAAALWQGAGTLTVLRTTFADNQSGTGGGGAVVINNAENVLIEESLFTRNSAYHGAGITYESGTTIIRDSTFSHNSAYVGAGIQADGTDLTITGSTIYSNNGDDGGGIYGSGQVTIINSTISGNEANYEGGGIYVQTVTLINSTVTGNQAYHVGGVGYRYEGATATIQASIIARNHSSNDDVAHDCLFAPGSMTSLGYSLIGTTTLCNWVSAAGDQTGTDVALLDPQLDVLADNGGPTLTHALLPGSPAIDAGGMDCPPTDQRGMPRPQGYACDTGAYEYSTQPVLDEIIYMPAIYR